MTEFKIVINDVKKGKSYQKIVTGNESEIFIGMKIGSKISGDIFGFKGYEFEVRGGSDNAGFPMRFDIEGIGRRRPYVSQGPGVRGLKHGQKTRKTIIGNTISQTIKQINLKIINYGQKPVEEVLGVQPKEEPKEEKKHKEDKKESKVEHKKPEEIVQKEE